MKAQLVKCRRLPGRVALWACLAAAIPAVATAADVVRVEEDWQLVVNQPDADLNGPQVTCIISPASVDLAYCAFDLNYNTQPNYSPGGLQMHLWNPDQPIVVGSFPVTGTMQQANETVTWTQSMSVGQGVFSFAVKNGQSTTWGSFDNSGEPLLAATTATDLNSYDPNVSLTNSGVCFASNLVTSLTLTAVRWYAADGTLIAQDTTPQAVHPQD